MYNITIDDVMSKTNEELYKIALDVYKKLKSDKKALDEWCAIEKDRWWFKKQQPKPTVNFPDLSEIWDWFNALEPEVLRKHICAMRDNFDRLNNTIISNDDIENVNKSYFINLFQISYTSKDVFDYIVKKYCIKNI
ncbi:MAG: hypothetical protein ACRCRT_01200 [Cetobacterium somerae]